MTVTLNAKQQDRLDSLKGWKFRLYLLSQLPMGWLAGLRVQEIGPDQCVTSVPFFWWNKNPFNSMYFAVQSMAAELSTAANCVLAVAGQKPSVAVIIVGCKANFLKKATSKVYFTCRDGHKAYHAVAQCLASGEAEEVTLNTVGTMSDGTAVAEFEFTWSFKARSNVKK